jgi:lactose/L-arabinose transport system substrate-binding protein
MCAFDPTDGGLIRVMLQSAGSWYYDNAGKPWLAGNKVMEAAVSTYAKLIGAPGTMKTSGWAEWVGAINSGKAASISTGVWIIGSVKAEASQAGNWAVAPIPRLDVPGAVKRVQPRRFELVCYERVEVEGCRDQVPQRNLRKGQ